MIHSDQARLFEIDLRYRLLLVALAVQCAMDIAEALNSGRADQGFLVSIDVQLRAMDLERQWLQVRAEFTKEVRGEATA